MYIVWMVMIGLTVGAAERLIMPGRNAGGIIAALLPPVTGSVAAGVAGRVFGFYQGPWEGPGFVTSVVGAILLLLLYRLIGGSLRRRIRAGLNEHDR